MMMIMMEIAHKDFHRDGLSFPASICQTSKSLKLIAKSHIPAYFVQGRLLCPTLNPTKTTLDHKH